MKEPRNNARRHRDVVALAALVLIAWWAHFASLGALGLHDEDMRRIPPVMDAGPTNLWRMGLRAFDFRTNEGRPLHELSIRYGSFVGYRLAGLDGVYALCAAVFAINLALMYALLRRLHPSLGFAVAGALVFALHPPDTTRNWLTMGLGGQPAVALVLVALHSYLSGRRWISYTAAAAALLCYELVFPVCFLAPLMRPGRRPPWRELFRHGALLSAILVGVVALRSVCGESRVAGLGGVVLINTLGNALIGPLLNLATLVYRPVEGLAFPAVGTVQPWQAQMPLALILVLGALVVAVVALALRRIAHRDGTTAAAPVLRLLVIGFAAMVLAYVLLLKIQLWNDRGLRPMPDGSWILGRNSRFNIAASIGAAITGGCAYLFAVRTFASQWAKRCALVGLLLALAGLLSAARFMQANYVASWRLQQKFWSETLELLADVGEDTPILLARSVQSGPDPGLVGTLKLAHGVLSFLHRWPESWAAPPHVLVLREGWEARLSADPDGKLVIDQKLVRYLRHDWDPVDLADVILLDARSGSVQRRDQLVAGGRVLQFKPHPGRGYASFPPRPLFHDLVTAAVEPYTP